MSADRESPINERIEKQPQRQKEYLFLKSLKWDLQEKILTEKTIFTPNWVDRNKSNKKIHFQIDGEYRGRINKLQAEIIPEALNILMPLKKGE